jgi:putative glutamine amidotransferase
MTIIAITTFRDPKEGEKSRTQVNNAYVQAVHRAGGLPLLIPIGIAKGDYNELLECVDGFVFSGGGDVNPRAYDKPMHPSIGGIDLDRDSLEIGLVHDILKARKPFLGICRGFQLTNIALGGTLHTHLADQYPQALHHACYPGLPRSLETHPVNVEPETKLNHILDAKQVWVNSLHHQGIERLAEGLRASAYAPDGLIEAWEIEEHPFALGVQWHPEAMPDSESSKKIFRELVMAASNQ